MLISLSAYSQKVKTIGPPGGTVREISYHPQNTSIIYAASNDVLLFRSNDGGTHTNFLGKFNMNYGNIAINPQNPNIIYFTGHRSIDGGDTWTELPVRGAYFVINPMNPLVVYAVNMDKGWVSRDGGNSWKSLPDPLPIFTEIFISQQDTSTLYASAVINNAAFMSTNSGADWENITTSLGPIGIITLEINPKNSNSLYLGTRYNGVFKTFDNGESWESVLTFGSSSEYATDIAVNPEDTSIVYVVTESRHVAGNVYKTTDGGHNWIIKDTDLDQPGAWPLNKVAINPQQPDEVCLGTEGWGVYKTENGGESWHWTKLTTTGVQSLYFDPDSAGHIYTGTQGQGILMTPDFGLTWKSLNFDIEQTIPRHVYDFILDPIDHDIAYAACDIYGLFKSTDRGKSWDLTPLPMEPGASVKTVNVCPHSGTVYVGQSGTTAYSGGLYKSTDGALTWQNLNIPKPYGFVQQIVIDPKEPDNLYIASYERGIVKTSDGGVTWKEINEGLEISNAPYYYPVLSLAIRKDSTNILYTAQRGGELYLTRNSGEQWVAISENLEILTPTIVVKDILISSIAPGKIYISVGRPYEGYGIQTYRPGGLFSTSNNGETWEQLFDWEVDDIAENPQKPEEIFISTDFGIVKLIDTTLTSIQHEQSELPGEYHLLTNFPNPFNQSTNIKYFIPDETKVMLKIYNQLGKEVITLINEKQTRGSYHVYWNGKNSQGGEVASGIYFCCLFTKDGIKSEKLLLIK